MDEKWVLTRFFFYLRLDLFEKEKTCCLFLATVYLILVRMENFAPFFSFWGGRCSSFWFEQRPVNGLWLLKL
jgi:hypothetical protein